MNHWRGVAGLVGAVLAVVYSADVGMVADVQTGGRIQGRVRLSGPAPGNAVIRMAADPMCSKINAGQRIVQALVVTDANGGLANAFVVVRGSFRPTAVSKTPVVIDQRGCIYVPRVVGARVGQILEVRNSDNLMHNIHAMSAKGAGFNVSQPLAGVTRRFEMKQEEMLRLRCDIHSWMTAYIGIVDHDHFAVSREGGVYEIPNVPPGTYTIDAWHERYGAQSQSVRVTAGGMATVDFTYRSGERPPAEHGFMGSLTRMERRISTARHLRPGADPVAR